MWAVFVLFNVVKSFVSSHFRALFIIYNGVGVEGKTPRKLLKNDCPEQNRRRRSKTATPPSPRKQVLCRVMAAQRKSDTPTNQDILRPAWFIPSRALFLFFGYRSCSKQDRGLCILPLTLKRKITACAPLLQGSCS